jgi:hypothetical protein
MPTVYFPDVVLCKIAQAIGHFWTDGAFQGEYPG